MRWKQEIADALIPLEGVNDVTATLTFQVMPNYDPDSDLPQQFEAVKIKRKVKVNNVAEVNANLVDGKNYVAGDNITSIAYTKYLEARKPIDTDPEILNSGIAVTLDDMRPLTNGEFGFDLGIDTLTIGAEVWRICAVQGEGWQNDDVTGDDPQPAKLKLVLRK